MNIHECANALEERSDALPGYWLDHEEYGPSELYYCQPCVETEYANSLAEAGGDVDYCLEAVVGGIPIESDCPVLCGSCGELLNYMLLHHGIGDEIKGFEEHGVGHRWAELARLARAVSDTDNVDWQRRTEHICAKVMRITVVAGLSYAGKTHARERLWPDSYVIDMRDYKDDFFLDVLPQVIEKAIDNALRGRNVIIEGWFLPGSDSLEFLLYGSSRRTPWYRADLQLKGLLEYGMPVGYVFCAAPPRVLRERMNDDTMRSEQEKRNLLMLLKKYARQYPFAVERCK